MTFGRRAIGVAFAAVFALSLALSGRAAAATFSLFVSDISCPVIGESEQVFLRVSGANTSHLFRIDTLYGNGNFVPGNPFLFQLSDQVAAGFAGVAATFPVTTTLTDLLTGESHAVTVPFTCTLENVTGQLPLNSGQINSLQTKLNAATAAAARGDTTAAANQLQAFINELEADVKSGKLTAAEAQPLIDAANARIANLP